MTMMVTVSGALSIRAVSAMAGGHRIGHRTTHRLRGIVAIHVCSRHPTEPPAAVLRARLQRDAGDRSDHPEPEESGKKPVCQGPPHGRQSMRTLRKRQATGNLYGASCVERRRPCVRGGIAAGKIAPTGIPSTSCGCANCICGSWRWLSRWSNSPDRQQRRWPMRSSRPPATVRMQPRTSRRTAGPSAHEFMLTTVRFASTLPPRSASRRRRPLAHRCPSRPSGRLSPSCSATRLPHSARFHIRADLRISSSRTA